MTPYTPRREVGVRLMIDTNCINARQANAWLNRLERWREDEVISILMAERANNEARAGSNVERSRKADVFIFTNSALISGDQKARHAGIAAALFPAGAQSESQLNDIEIVYQAADWGHILVTNDGDSNTQPRGILGARAALKGFGATVMRPEEAVAFTEGQILVRDERTRSICASVGLDLPQWVGQD